MTYLKEDPKLVVGKLYQVREGFSLHCGRLDSNLHIKTCWVVHEAGVFMYMGNLKSPLASTSGLYHEILVGEQVVWAEKAMRLKIDRVL